MANEKYNQIAQYAEDNNVCVYGIKGETPLADTIQIPNQVPLDYMHLVLQGHARWLLNQFLNSDKSNNYYIGNKINLININLKSAQTLHNITRKIRSINEYLK